MVLKMKLFFLIFLIIFFGCENNYNPQYSYWNDNLYSGTLSYFDSEEIGSCGFEDTNGFNTGSLNSVNYGDGEVCGGCVEVIGPKGRLTIKIVDECIECTEGSIKINKDSFSAISDISTENSTAAWKFVSCPANRTVNYRIVLVWKFILVQPRNNKIPIKKIELYSDENWIELERDSDNYFSANVYWEFNDFKIRATSVENTQIISEHNWYKERQIYETYKQFK